MSVIDLLPFFINKLQVLVVWNDTLRRWVSNFRRFGRLYCFNFSVNQSKMSEVSLLLTFEGGKNFKHRTALRNLKNTNYFICQ
jgi:hypothetical protein